MNASQLGSKLQNHLKQSKVKTLKIVAIQLNKTITTNFEKEGRPAPWKKSIKSKKNKGTKTGVIKGNMKRVTTSVDIPASAAVATTNPLSRPYVKRFHDGGEFKTKARSQKYETKITATGKKLDVFVKNSRKRGADGKPIKSKDIKAGIAKQDGRKFMLIPDEDVPKYIDAVKDGFAK